MSTAKTERIWKAVAITAIRPLLVVSAFYALGAGWKQPERNPVAPAADALSLWTAESRGKKERASFVKNDVKQTAAGYVPIENPSPGPRFTATAW